MPNKYEGLREISPAPLRAVTVVSLTGKKSRSSNNSRKRRKPNNKSSAWIRNYMEV